MVEIIYITEGMMNTETTIGVLRAKLVASHEVLRKLWAITLAGRDHEVSGLGEVDLLPGDVYRLTPQIHLFKQDGSAGHTELDVDDIGRMLTDMIRMGTSPKRLRFWYHTHVRMPAFFSGTDKNTIRELSREWMTETLIAGVFNHFGETQWCIVCNGVKMRWQFQLPGAPPRGDELNEAQKLVKAAMSYSQYGRQKYHGRPQYIGPYDFGLNRFDTSRWEIKRGEGGYDNDW